MTSHRSRLRSSGLLLFAGLVAISNAVAGEDPAALAQAKNAHLKQQFDEAIKLYRRANAAEGGKCAECLWGLAAAYNEKRAYRNTAETCEELIALHPPAHMLAQAWNLKGRAIVTQAKADNILKRLPEAEEAFRNAIAADPNLHVAHFNLGMSMLTRSDDEGGLTELRTYLAKDPEGREANAARRLIENPRRARENFAPGFAFATLDGSYLDLDDLRGKVVMLDFWGSWCRPCVDSVGALRRINRRYEKSPFVLISISVGDPEDRWRQFVAANQMSWPQYLDERRDVSRAYGVQAFPSYVVIDHEGVVKYATYGNRTFTEAKIQFAIEDALKKLAKTGSN